jgi:Amt family ammonium transporter
VFSASHLGGLGLDEGVSVGGQFGIQLLGIVVTMAWCAAASLVLLKVIAIIVPLRVSAEEENEGLDLVLHEERGYNI